MVVFVLAAAGYGKTTQLRRRHTDPSTVWLSGLPRLPLPEASAIVIDDVPALSADEATCLLQAAVDQPVTIASRYPLPISTARLRGQGLFSQLGPADLALDAAAGPDLLVGDYGLRDPDLCDRVIEATAGWPALVRLCGEALAAGEPFLPEPGSPLWTYITDEILAPLPPDALRLLAEMAELAPITTGLADALGHQRAAEIVPLLSGTGLLVEERLVPVIAHIVRRNERSGRAAMLAGLWYEEHGPPVSAVKAFALAGRTDQCGRLLDSHGEAMLSAGHAGVIAEVTTAIAPANRSRRQQLLLGDALRTSGSVINAAQAYAVVADREPTWDCGVAWRMGLVHYLRGDSHGALKAFSRAEDTEQATADLALLLSWRACAHLQLGETSTALETAKLACRTAVSASDDIALATAYVSLALCHSMTGETTDSDELYAQALSIAEQRGHVVLRARILTSQTYQLLNEARYAEALEAARQTTRCAITAGHTNLQSIALCNSGDALLMLGRYDEATRQYERAQALCRRMGSRRSAAAHLGLGEVYRRRGWSEQARGAYEAAATLAEESGLNQVRVCALAGLARVLLADDPAAAAQTAEQATRLASDRVVVTALLAQAWIALHTGDTATAAALANDAAKVARAERDPAGLAESLEIRAAVESELSRSRAALREAQAIWSGAGAVVDAARALSKLGHLPGAETDDRLGALLAVETLAGAGVPVTDNGLRQAENAVLIRAFGRFEVCLHGQVVPPTQWQSRKARDLLRILVARRGRPVPRGELCEMLWPDDDPAKTGHRLSVLLSIVKGVLDPERALPADHYLVSDQASIGLDTTRLRIDVEEFLTDVGHGRRLRERGATAEVYRLLSVTVQSYRADVFEDEPYSEWSTALREEARAAHVSALRMLSQAARKLGRVSAAVSHLMRLLSIDPYDEAGHRALIETLVTGGQHGEAQRAKARYRDAMRAIGVKPT